jgi:hypothetical protein
VSSRSSEHAANKSLQGTFDPLPIFADAKTVIASSTPELRRSASSKDAVVENGTFDV